MNTKHGKMVYSPTDKMKKEIKRAPNMRSKLFNEYRRAGKLKIVSAETVEEKKKNLRSYKSNDPDVLALALVAEVTLLVAGDKKLRADFERIIPGGRIYRTKDDASFLRKDLCP